MTPQIARLLSLTLLVALTATAPGCTGFIGDRPPAPDAGTLSSDPPDAGPPDRPDASESSVADGGDGGPGPGQPDAGAVVVAGQVPLEVVNDLAFERAEVAFASVPLPRAANVVDTALLDVLDAAGNPVPAQFTPVARWGSTVADPVAPLKWLGVAVDVNVPASTRAALRLVRREAPPARPSLLRSLGAGRYRVATGAADFELDSAAGGLVTSARVGGVELLQGPFGPKVVDDAGNLLEATVDSGGVEIEEEGAVRVVVKVRGHFARVAPSGSACASALAYAARLTFLRGRGSVGLEWDLHNECGNGQVNGSSPEGADFFGHFYRIREARWDAPVLLPGGVHLVRTDAVVRRSAASPGGVSGVVQGHGQSRAVAGVTVWRRARVLLDGAQADEREAFLEPTVAMANGAHAVHLTAAWLRFREPAAVTARGSTLSFALVAEALALGEAQVRWGFAEFDFVAGPVDDALLLARSRAQVASLERGLLVTTPVATLNAARVRPRLPQRQTGARLEAYAARISSLHGATLLGFERWKKYGLIWPDTLSNNSWAADALDPTQSSNGSNYWSASASELAEHLRTGDPKWAWEFAYPLEQTFLKAHVYNRGTLEGAGDLKSGFTTGSSLIGSNQVAGTAFRSGWNSDDYLYNQGSDEAYLLRYGGAVRDVFAQACRSALRRYGGTGAREQFVSERRVTRQTLQHFNMLRYAAEFIREPQLAGQCRELLLEIVAELGNDNLFGGIACTEDMGNRPTCSTEQNFMYSALTSEFFWGVHSQWAGRPQVAAVGPTLTTMARQYYQVMMPRLPGSPDIDVNGTWAKFLQCTFDGQGRLVACVGQQGSEPSWAEERPSHVSVLLIGDAVAASPTLCAVGARALGAALAADLWGGWTRPSSGAGWYKGASQAMLNVVSGIGVAEQCAPD